jgi:hypothetical protein
MWTHFGVGAVPTRKVENQRRRKILHGLFDRQAFNGHDRNGRRDRMSTGLANRDAIAEMVRRHGCDGVLASLFDADEIIAATGANRRSGP